jgi:hypothetical protein
MAATFVPRPQRRPLGTPVRPAGSGGGTVGPAGPPGPTGPAGATGPAGPGVAPGGTTGQLLTKASAVDYATLWTTPATPPATTVGASAPASPVVGQLWWRTTDGNLYIYYDDGTSQQFVPATASVGKLLAGQWYLIAGSLGGVPAAGLSLGLYVAALAFTLPAGLAGSQAVAKTAATAQTDFDVRVNGTSKGTIRWAAAATVASFLFATAVAIAIGDRVEILAPTPADATLADPAWTLKGTL